MRVIGVGTDIVDVRRVARLHARYGARFARRILARAEWAPFERAARPAVFLAGRFAVKEAVAKALGCGIGALRWSAIEVARAESGRPTARLAADAPGAGAVLHVSLAGERHYAVACALALEA